MRLARRQPHHSYNPPPGLAEEYEKLLEEEIREGIVEETDPTNVLWNNPTFLVPKKNGKFRKILDCRELNAELRDTAFKMEGAETVRDLLHSGDWATSLDIHSAFSHIPVHPNLQPYLAFRFKNKTYRYCGMPFGVKHAPRVFTTLMRRAAGAIRTRWGTRLVTYMDDILLLFTERTTAERQTQEIATYLETLGWTLATEKCERTPTQRIDFLGWEWDLQIPAVRMTPARRTEIRTQLTSWITLSLRRLHTPVRSLAALIGNLNFLRLQFPEASLHMKALDKLKNQVVSRQSWEGQCTANPTLLGDLKWWSRATSQNLPTPLLAWPTVATLTTDASPHGWGATLMLQDQEHFTFGYWNQTQSTWTSNAKELRAVEMAIHAFRSTLLTLRHTTVLLRSDNSAVVANINRQSAGATLAPHLLHLLTELRRLDLHLTATHIPGVTNTQADALSRMGREREYFLTEELLTHITQQLQITPTLDAFAASPFLQSDTAPRHPRDGLHPFHNPTVFITRRFFWKFFKYRLRPRFDTTIALGHVSVCQLHKRLRPPSLRFREPCTESFLVGKHQLDDHRIDDDGSPLLDMSDAKRLWS
jgi:ribonuclease HI